ncbi:MAG: hypothetical protein JNJ54_19355 [Myxococcaceae bacterium]|nr:hypothetical protein [Myxococcaceae bacterium]
MSGFFGLFRGAFMPLGLFALVAVGVHAAADLADDKVLALVDALDAWADAWLARWELTAGWVDRVGPLQRTLIARLVALAWELAVDVFVAVPQLGYSEADEHEAKFSFRRETWRTLFSRVNRQPTPMRLVRPLVTFVFAGGAAYAVARLVESTLFVALQGGVATPEVAEVLARVFGAAAIVLVLASHGWRAVLRALEHADAACEARVKLAKSPWVTGLWGSVLSFPLAVALLLEAHNLLALFR